MKVTKTDKKLILHMSIFFFREICNCNRRIASVVGPRYQKILSQSLILLLYYMYNGQISVCRN
jgi:hypothetical protein